jgi:glyoxylase-like metal-dependent hydrolase (beta-lactamase superfamily II)
VEEGLGNACLLQLPDGTFGVIDWGTQSEDALETFFDAVDGPIAFIAATHAHADHTLGLPRLLEACGDRGVPVGRFVYPASSLHKEQRHLTLARTMARTLDVRTSAVHVDDFGGPAGLMGAALSGVRRGMARARAESTE